MVRSFELLMLHLILILDSHKKLSVVSMMKEIMMCSMLQIQSFVANIEGVFQRGAGTSTCIVSHFTSFQNKTLFTTLVVSMQF